MPQLTGTAIDICKFLLSDNVDKNALWDIEPHKAPHSNQQRKYFHRLVCLLAKGEREKFFTKKNELIRNYGNGKFIYDKEGKPVVEYLPDNDDYKHHETKHYYPLEYGGKVQNAQGKGVVVRAFLLLEGTSSYSISDYLHLIECTRNECIGSDIPMEEVETYEEKRLMEMLREKADAEKQKNKSV